MEQVPPVQLVEQQSTLLAQGAPAGEQLLGLVAQV
jgi:hypothetical protein